MARKRQIDPVYPFEAEIRALTINARYFYIMSWCHMNDANEEKKKTGGVMPYDLFFLKSHIFPSDEIDIAPIVEELIAQKRYYSFEAEGKQWIWCPTMSVHQVINHPSNSNYPNPPKEIQEHYRSGKGALTPNRMSGVEVNRVEKSPAIPQVIHKPEDQCDKVLTFMTGLDLTSKQQTEILKAWGPGLKARTRCYDCDKCRKDFMSKVKETKAANPRDFGAYFMKAINNFITGD
jgi:hypothetical protein